MQDELSILAKVAQVFRGRLRAHYIAMCDEIECLSFSNLGSNGQAMKMEE
jgi:hypothetical protein